MNISASKAPKLIIAYQGDFKNQAPSQENKPVTFWQQVEHNIFEGVKTFKISLIKIQRTLQ